MAKKKPGPHDLRADQIRDALALKNWSQAKLAAKVGISQRHLSVVLNGHAGASNAVWDAMAAAVGYTWTITLEPKARKAA